MKRILSCVVLGILVFAACSKKDDVKSCPPPAEDMALAEERIMDQGAMNTDRDFSGRHQQISFKTLLELLQARAASARYRDFDKAKKDGYIDIDVKMQNMGYHYMRTGIVDDKFDPSKPEILVYNKRRNGKFELVAVEYAIPLDKSANAPKGFTGSADVWDHNETFGLWLLHAWVWQFNPDGVFHPTNPTVHVAGLPENMSMPMHM